jgi:hypothetical protein
MCFESDHRSDYQADDQTHGVVEMLLECGLVHMRMPYLMIPRLKIGFKRSISCHGNTGSDESCRNCAYQPTILDFGSILGCARQSYEKFALKISDTLASLFETTIAVPLHTIRTLSRIDADEHSKGRTEDEKMLSVRPESNKLRECIHHHFDSDLMNLVRASAIDIIHRSSS